MHEQTPATLGVPDHGYGRHGFSRTAWLLKSREFKTAPSPSIACIVRYAKPIRVASRRLDEAARRDLSISDRRRFPDARRKTRIGHQPLTFIQALAVRLNWPTHQDARPFAPA